MESNIHSPLLEPSLWGLRNLTHNNRPVMTRMGRKGGMELLLDVVRRYVAQKASSENGKDLQSLIRVFRGWVSRQVQGCVVPFFHAGGSTSSPPGDASGS